MHRHFLDKDAVLTPFNRAAAGAMKISLDDFAKANDIRLDNLSSKLKARNMKVVTKTFHNAGLVVPVDKDTDVGYRSLIETDGKFLPTFFKPFYSILSHCQLLQLTSKRY